MVVVEEAVVVVEEATDMLLLAKPWATRLIEAESMMSWCCRGVAMSP